VESSFTVEGDISSFTEAETIEIKERLKLEFPGSIDIVVIISSGTVVVTYTLLYDSVVKAIKAEDKATKTSVVEISSWFSNKYKVLSYSVPSIKFKDTVPDIFDSGETKPNEENNSNNTIVIVISIVIVLLILCGCGAYMSRNRKQKDGVILTRTQDRTNIVRNKNNRVVPTRNKSVPSKPRNKSVPSKPRNKSVPSKPRNKSVPSKPRNKSVPSKKSKNTASKTKVNSKSNYYNRV